MRNIFAKNIYVRSKFFCVRSSHDLCARTPLRGNIDCRQESVNTSFQQSKEES